MNRLEALDAADEQESGCKFAHATYGKYILHARRFPDGSEQMIQMLVSSGALSKIKEIAGFVLMRGDDPDPQLVPPEQWPLVEVALEWKPVARYKD